MIVVGKRGVRVGAAAIALGLSLAGPQAVGIAAADSAEADSSSVSAGGTPKRETRGAVARTARTSARNSYASPARGSGDSFPSVAEDSESETVVAPEPDLESHSALGDRVWQEAPQPGPTERGGAAAVPKPEVLRIDDVEIATHGRVFAVDVPVVAEVPGSLGVSEAASAVEPPVVSVIAPQTPVMTAAAPAAVSARD